MLSLIPNRQPIAYRHCAVAYAIDAELEVVAVVVVASYQDFFVIHDMLFNGFLFVGILHLHIQLTRLHDGFGFLAVGGPVDMDAESREKAFYRLS